MLNLKFAEKPGLAYKVLCLGAHSDDIEIGCGGTILKLVEQYPNIVFQWVIFSASLEREREAICSASKFLADVAQKQIIIKSFKDGYLPFIATEVKEAFEQIKQTFNPDLIFTHYNSDAHQDHRLISALTWNTFRNHLILEYEIPKYDGDLGNPSFFVPLESSICQAKIKHLIDSFPSQKDKQWFSEETFLAILRIRGIESNAPDKYAEAFHVRKIVF